MIWRATLGIPILLLFTTMQISKLMCMEMMLRLTTEDMRYKHKSIILEFCYLLMIIFLPLGNCGEFYQSPNWPFSNFNSEIKKVAD